ncbi:MAG: DASS family sodium-coupled anion symporter [Phycisphaeraceae bacterium]|nr:DASS family sodium-coupled anion symporter [Phycisphaeraceae bacterium]
MSEGRGPESEASHRTTDGGSGESHPMLQRAGLILGPILGAIVYAAMPDSLGHPPRAAAAIGVLMAIWWMTEAVALPVTSLIPAALFPLFGVVDARTACAPYANEIIFLFAGGLVLGLAMQRCGLHVRIALITIALVGTRPKRLIAGFMLATALMSMWVSNTATAVMMLPIGASVVDLVKSHARGGGEENARQARNFAVCLMLAIAFGASIGGIGTLIGTPPNLVFAGYIKQAYGQEIDFMRWMRVGVPMVAVYLPIAWAVLVYIAFPVRMKEIPGGRELILNELRELGRPVRSEWIVLGVFLTAVMLWVFRSRLDDIHALRFLGDGVIAMCAALVLFFVPRGRVGPAGQPPGASGGMVMDWATASKLPWGVLLLFGGGLSLGSAMTATNLDGWIGELFTGMGGLHPVVLVAILVVAVVGLSELASNTAVATALMPVLGAAAVGLGVHPYVLLLPAVLASSCGLMLPVATPPNTVVFASGHVGVRDMVKAGFLLDVVGIVLVIVIATTVAGPLLGEDLSIVPEWAGAKSP